MRYKTLGETCTSLVSAAYQVLASQLAILRDKNKKYSAVEKFVDL